MKNNEFNMILDRFTQKRKFHTFMICTMILICVILYILQLNHNLISNFGFFGLLLLNTLCIMNISSRSSFLFRTMTDYHRLKARSYEPFQSFNPKLSTGLENDIRSPLSKEIKINSNLLYGIGIVTIMSIMLYSYNILTGQLNAYQNNILISSILYYFFFGILIVVNFIIYSSEKRLGKIQSKFFEYSQKLDNDQIHSLD